MFSGKLVNPSEIRTAPGSENGWLSRARGLDALRWIGLVSEPLSSHPDELARQSLTTVRPADGPEYWFF